MKLLHTLLLLAAVLVAPLGSVRAEEAAPSPEATQGEEQVAQSSTSDEQPADDATDATSEAAPDDASATPAKEAPKDFASGVKALNSDDFDDKIAAIEFLATLPEPRVADVLRALGSERLFSDADGRIVLATPDRKYIDAVTGEPLPDLKTGDLLEVGINNRLRGLLQGVMGQFGLTSADPAARSRAAAAIADQPTADLLRRIEAALAKETDPSVRAVMQSTLSSLDLVSEDKARRLAAVNAFAGSNDPVMRGRIQRLLATEKDAEVRAAAEAAVTSIESRLKVIGVAVSLFEGLSLGSILLLAAIGLSVTFGVMGVINMAHGEMIMLGAYTAYTVQTIFRAFLPPGMIELYLIAAIPVAFAVTALVGIALERTVIRYLYGRALETLLATWGISLILQQVVRSIFGAQNQEVANPAWMTGGMALAGGFTLTWNRLVIIIFCLAVVAALAALLRYSSFGLHMRAVSQNRPMASSMGIRTGRVDAFTFGLGSGIAGIAGVALSQIGNVSPNLGQLYIVNSFMVVVFGGVGSVWGTIAGAFSLGVATKFIEPWAGAIVGQILVLVFIILFIQRRPRGLFALKGRTVES